MDKRLKYFFIFSPVFILFLGALQHSIYEILPYNFVAVWAPVSESVLEHLKIVFYPTLFWYLIVFLIFNKKFSINSKNFLYSATVSSILAPVMVIFLYYTAFFALNIEEKLVIHIIIQTISVIIGQLLGYHIYKFATEKIKVFYVILITIIIFIIIIFAVFSFYPPNLPLFIEQ